MKRLFVGCLVLCTLIPLSTSAVVISLDPDNGTYGPGETFVTVVRIDTESQEECINAVDLLLSYPKDIVKVSAISRGESILSLWAEEPSFSSDAGTISLVGGIPGGYCGRVMGDPGKTNIVAKIVWSVPGTQIGGNISAATTTIPITFAPTSYVLLNDGAGTRAETRFTTGKFVRVPESRNLSNEWLGMIADDTFPPDDFTAQVVQDQNILNGKYALVWNTVDKQSGISHYEVLEEDPNVPGKVRGKKVAAHWVRAESPYLLTDQELLSRITVRAIDQAGNRKEFSINRVQGTPSGISARTGEVGNGYIAGFSVLVLLIIIMIVMLRRRRLVKKDTNHQDYHDDTMSV